MKNLLDSLLYGISSECYDDCPCGGYAIVWYGIRNKSLFNSNFMGKE